MIYHLQLIRNVGQFDSVGSGANIPFEKLTLIYAENGRGKTTLSTILRSLKKGDPILIKERHRLGSPHQPHVIIDCDGGPPMAIYQNEIWNRTFPNMEVFDDVFIEENICSGLIVNSTQRQNLYEFILGAQGVTLNQQLQQLIDRIEAHNVALRTKGSAIPEPIRGGLSVDDFCALQNQPNIDESIQAIERSLTAVREQDILLNASSFKPFSLPELDISLIENLLQQDISSLNAQAASSVQAHLKRIGEDGETWIAEGMGRIPESLGNEVNICPFCAQDLGGSPIFQFYGAYFSEAYNQLKDKIIEALTEVSKNYGNSRYALFESEVRLADERRQFWSRFIEVPELGIDINAIIQDWQNTFEQVASTLNMKRLAPLDRIKLAEECLDLINVYKSHCEMLKGANRQLEQANTSIEEIKRQAASGKADSLTTQLNRLKAIKERYSTPIDLLCTDYLNEKNAKSQTERQRDQTRAALEQYKTSIFPRYQTSINHYLQRFNAGFYLDCISSMNNRAGTSCTYNVIINQTPVPVDGRTPVPGEISFRNTLSAGDRSTLALAFFFASLDHDPSLATKVVIIDDPVSSLDEHRSLSTVQEVRRLVTRAGQVIVLSHSKSFLCRLWDCSCRASQAAVQIIRDTNGSSIEVWNINQDCITEHDRRHALLRTYLIDGTTNERETAQAIRPLLEAFLRVVCPEHFPPGTMLGPFRHSCEQKVGTRQQILNVQDIQELQDLTEYANRFHHDTNPAWETENINGIELQGYVRRALAFTSR